MGFANKFHHMMYGTVILNEIFDFIDNLSIWVLNTHHK